jgi:transposase
MDDRKALTGILFVLKSDIPWEMLPREMGCGCGMTCWRRLRDWQKAGVWAALHRVLLDRLGAVPPVRQCAGRPRRRPAKLHADRAFDSRAAAAPAASGTSPRASRGAGRQL